MSELCVTRPVRLFSGCIKFLLLLVPWQVVRPAVVPPPPFKSYVRGITTRTTEMLLQDLQAEGKRLRELSVDSSGVDLETSSSAFQDEESMDANSDQLKKLTGSRRKPRKSKWRLKEDSCP